MSHKSKIKFKLLVASLITTLAISAFFVMPASAAANPTSTSRPNIAQRIDNKKAAFCSRIENKLNNMKTRVEARIQFRQDNLGVRTGKLQTLLTIAQGYGIDVTTAQADIQTMQSKITNVTNLIVAVKSELDAIDTTDCSNNFDSVTASIQSVLTKVAEIRSAKAENLSYFNNTLQPALKDVRAQIKALKKK